MVTDSLTHSRPCAVYLSGCVRADELLVDLLGLSRQLGGVGGSVVLTGQVESYILLTELGVQEGSEQTQSIWRESEEEGQ